MDDTKIDQRNQRVGTQYNAGTIHIHQGTPPAPSPDSSPERVDIALITAKSEEYGALLRVLGQPHKYQGTRSKPSQYSWTLGTIPHRDTNAPYRIVLASTHEQGNVSAAIATKETCDMFHPRYVIFVGIAGSLKEWVKQGDIVIGNYVWCYGYGRVEKTGEYTPRHQYTVPLDNALKSSADTFAQWEPDWNQGIAGRPDNRDTLPELHFGGIASGDIVIESVESAFGKAILAADPDLYAVAMEEHGTAQAVRQLQQTEPIGLLVVRGITDIPAGVITAQAEESAAAAGHDVRKQWTNYVTTVAARFVHRFIAAHLPYAPDTANP